jgi:hypothetical protein
MPGKIVPTDPKAAEMERRKARAARFGIPLNIPEDEKKELRAARSVCRGMQGMVLLEFACVDNPDRNCLCDYHALRPNGEYPDRFGLAQKRKENATDSGTTKVEPSQVTLQGSFVVRAVIVSRS